MPFSDILIQLDRLNINLNSSPDEQSKDHFATIKFKSYSKVRIDFANSRSTRRFKPYEKPVNKQRLCPFCSQKHFLTENTAFKINASIYTTQACTSRHYSAVVPNDAAYLTQLSKLMRLIDRDDLSSILPRSFLDKRLIAYCSTGNRGNRRLWPSACSLQARRPSSDQSVNITELAAYFEDFLYLPKKMSPMAENMYA